MKKLCWYYQDLNLLPLDPKTKLLTPLVSRPLGTLAMWVHTATYNLRCTFKLGKCLEKIQIYKNSINSQYQRNCNITSYLHIKYMWKNNKIEKLCWYYQDLNLLPLDPKTKLLTPLVSRPHGPLGMWVHTTTYNLRCTFKLSKCLEKIQKYIWIQ